MDYKVVILGSCAVGKSAICIQYLRNQFMAEYDPTIEEQYRFQTTIDDKPCILDIIDTAGMEEFNAMQDQVILYYFAFDAFLLFEVYIDRRNIYFGICCRCSKII
jgi:GTPase KRas protein